MPWWLILIIAIAMVLAYAAWDHRKESRHLAEIFAPLAEKHRGVVTAGRLLALPQLRFTLDQRPFLATAMANSGAIGKVRGPFTFVEVALATDSGQEILIARSSPLGRAAKPLAVAVAPGSRWCSGDPAFDEAFSIKGGDAAFLAHFLGREPRQRLLDSRLPGLELRVQGSRISAHCEGIAETPARVEELTALCRLAASNSPTER